MNNIKSTLKKASDKINVNNLTEMYYCIKEINEKNKYNKYKDEMKQLIQLIIDYLIYGDKKKDQSLFENFCELDFMKEFIIASKSQNYEILLQIIKSMSALILTIVNKASLFYIFSNNFINQIITNDIIQESNEDFLSFYVNFIKSLAMKIDTNTIELFYQKEINSFPLLENAIKLYNHSDSMIKNVVRNIFLTFAKMDYLPLKKYFTTLPMLSYFACLGCRLTDMTIELNYLSGYESTLNNKEFIFDYDKFKSLHDDLIDEILYLQDILGLNNKLISTALINSLLHFFVCPLLLKSIYVNALNDNNTIQEYNKIVSIEVALYIFTLMLFNIHNDSFLNIICNFLFNQKINPKILEKYINLQKFPELPNNYVYQWQDQKIKSKEISYVQYITYNFNREFICNLIMKPNKKYREINTLNKKYQKEFDNPEFNPIENFERIYKDAVKKFINKDFEFMKHYHKIISLSTGIQCGLSENDNEDSILNEIAKEENLIENPIRKIIFDDLFKFNNELINMGINILLYSVFYTIQLDTENKSDINRSISKKLLYNECKLGTYHLFSNKLLSNKYDNNDRNNDNNENKFNAFKTELYEQKYNQENYKEYFYDNNLINILLNVLEINTPYCPLELLLIVYNIKYILYPIKKHNNTNKNNILSKNVNKTDLINSNGHTNNISSNNNSINNLKSIITLDHKTKLKNILNIYLIKINIILSTNSNLKKQSYEYLENVWKTYHSDYEFNKTKNLIIKYILTPYYFSNPFICNNVEDFPFKTRNAKNDLNICLFAYLAINDLINDNDNNKFPIENGNIEYSVGDKINLSEINVPNSKNKFFTIQLKKNMKNDFVIHCLYVYKNSLIIGNEDNNFLKVEYVYPLREVEVCLDNEFPNGLQLYFKKTSHIIKFDSNDERKEVKTELENKRNEYRKWEQEQIVNYFAEEEKKYSTPVTMNLIDFS